MRSCCVRYLQPANLPAELLSSADGSAFRSGDSRAPLLMLISLADLKLRGAVSGCCALRGQVIGGTALLLLISLPDAFIAWLALLTICRVGFEDADLVLWSMWLSGRFVSADMAGQMPIWAWGWFGLAELEKLACVSSLGNFLAAVSWFAGLALMLQRCGLWSVHVLGPVGFIAPSACGADWPAGRCCVRLLPRLTISAC
ncbi:hypothetical protein Nepgr_001058 [Nepenthes gracilis]|uniref:Uncharacterized protein n=1 Tax=Nepenthes gracilis TaxID=150966 RepID=A0AAD3P3U2_NEPGR|nr:hypothetical protein Nepgr_001058 [Nepenthes gracilis]